MTQQPLLPYKISICGLSELGHFCDVGVSHVLTILDPDWPDPGEFEYYGEHSRLIWRFHDIIHPRPGWFSPDRETVRKVLEFGDAVRERPVEHLLIHCHMGVSRSTATAAILLAQHNPGRERQAFDTLYDMRPRSWPNSLMIRLADEELGRKGALVEAMRLHHVRVATNHPDFAEDIRLGERAHEVPD